MSRQLLSFSMCIFAFLPLQSSIPDHWEPRETDVAILGADFPVTLFGRFDHQPEVLDRIGVGSLLTTRMDVSARVMETLVAHLFQGEIDAPYWRSRPPWMLVIYIYDAKRELRIEERDTMGFSLFFMEGQQQYHALFSREGGHSRPTPGYRLPYRGDPDGDELRLLHLSFAPSHDRLPERSELVVIVNEEDPRPPQEKSDDELALRILTDPERNAGRFASALYNGGEYFRTGRVSVRLGPLDVPSEDFRFIRDEVLEKSRRGRQYIYDLYKYGHLAKRAPGNLAAYARLVPEILAAIDRLRAGPEQSIVLDHGLADALRAIITTHQTTSNPGFARALDRLEVDIDFLEGKTKRECLEYLMHFEP